MSSLVLSTGSDSIVKVVLFSVVSVCVFVCVCVCVCVCLSVCQRDNSWNICDIIMKFSQDTIKNSDKFENG